MTALTIDAVIAKYMKLRAEKDKIEAEAKTEVDKIKVNMTKIESWLKQQADAQGVTSFKTKAGTAFLTTADAANVENWDAILKFVLDNQMHHFLQKAVSKVAIRQYIEEHKTVPPGVKYATRIEVNIRKPEASA